MKEWIYIACKGDQDLLKYFDPAFSVRSTEEAADVIYQKIISNYPESRMKPIQYEGEVVGFMCWLPGLLISFGINIDYRKPGILSKVWDLIIATVGESFSCVLYTQNVRAINWLRRCGMQVLGENLTILINAKKEESCQQEVS